MIPRLLLIAAAASPAGGCAAWMPDWHSPAPFALPPRAGPSGFARAASSRPPAPAPSGDREPAADPPSPAVQYPASGVLELAVQDAVLLAFENNRNLRVRRLDPAVARTDVTVERAAFDPTVTVSTGLVRSREQIPDNADPVAGDPSAGALSSTFRRSRSDRAYSAAPGIGQTLPTGTAWNLLWEWRQTDSDTSRADHFGRIGLELRQPLLRNFGPAFQLAGIEIAVRNAELSAQQFAEAAMDVAAEVERGFWSLVQAQLDYAVQEELLERSRRRLTDNRERVRIGARNVDATDLAQNEADVASREERLLAAADEIDRRRLALLRLVNPEGRSAYWRLKVATVAPDLDPARLPAPPEEDASIAAALAARPEIRQVRLGVAVNDLRLRQARNQLLPQLDLVLDYGPTGRGRDLGRSLGSVWDFRHNGVDLSLQGSYPLGNRAADGRRLAAELTRDQSRLSAEDVEQRVELEVLDALRGVSISAKRWRAALVTLEKTARKLELAEEAVRLGKLGFSEFNILQFQDELTAARLSVNQNYADYLRSRTALLRAEGRILSARGLTVE